jgi:serine/threonine-protein kinase
VPDTAIDRLTTALAGRYALVRELGAGGMATVYLARDLRHERQVAVKVLRPELAAVLGAERFFQEIRVTSQLQHPHILPLFDSGQVEGLLFYVMPYIEGESLRGRLVREKQLGVDDAVRLASEVASALDYAHRHGVIHRDIKPENILLHDGRATVADFGIALAVQQAGGSRITETGLSLGTPQYMSPEQATADRELDPRSDVYSLAAVLYEMLAGEPPHTGGTTQAVIAALITEEPRPVNARRRTVPDAVAEVVHRALQKLPADRYATAGDFAAALAQAGTVRTASTRPTSPAASRRSAARQLIPWAVAAVAATALAWSRLRPPPPSSALPPIQYILAPPAESRLLDLSGSPIAMAPDGSALVYVGAVAARQPRNLYLWPLDRRSPAAIAGTDNAWFPFFSPDGKSVGYLAGDQLRRVSLAGGAPVSIGSAMGSGSFRGAAWTERGEIVFVMGSTLHRIPAEGGTSSRIPVPDSLRFLWPDALPGGEAIVASVLSPASTDPAELAAITVDDGQVRRLGVQGTGVRYVEPGRLVYATQDGILHSVAFDPKRLRVLDAPRVVAESVMVGTAGGVKMGVARNGTAALLEGAPVTDRRLVRVDRNGKELELDAPPRVFANPRISPDGRRIAVVVGMVPNPPMDIWVYDLALGNLVRLTTDSTSANPEWSPDSRRIYYRRTGSTFIAMAAYVDGRRPDSLYATSSDLWEVIGTRGGDTLVTRELTSVQNDRDLLLVSLRDGGKATEVAAGPRVQAEPALSPDGKWLAYSSEESGQAEVYVKAFPGPGPRYQLSSNGGLSPRWGPRGSELYFLARDSLIAMPIRVEGGELVPGRGRGLFPNRYLPGGAFHASYDVAPDGTWFIFVGGGPVTSSGIRVLLNH